jgi:hypothetical protein
VCDQLARQRRQTIGLTVSVPLVNYHALTLYITEIPEARSERADKRMRCHRQPANAKWPRLLCLDHERRGEESEGDTAPDKLSAVHH